MILSVAGRVSLKIVGIIYRLGKLLRVVLGISVPEELLPWKYRIKNASAGRLDLSETRTNVTKMWRGEPIACPCSSAITSR